MKIRGKLTFLTMTMGLVPLTIAALAAFFLASQALQTSSTDRLSALRDAKQQQIELYFRQIRDQAVTMAGSSGIVDAMRSFSSAFRSHGMEHAPGLLEQRRIKSSVETYYRDQFGNKYQAETGKPANITSMVPTDPNVLALQAAYIADNPHPLGEKDQLDSAGDGTRYAELHAKYHPQIRDFLTKFGYYDIFLVDIDTGHIVYSVFKELDFATSLLDGPYAQTNFADAFRKAAAANTPGTAFLVDYAAYTPSYEAAAAFIATPVFDDGVKTGVLIFQMPIDRITEVLSQRTGMGETGEVYMVGDDLSMRSNSRFDENSTILSKTVDTTGVHAALAGKTAVDTFPDYRGVEVLSAYAPLAIDDVSWAILAEIDAAEAFADARQLGWILFALAAVTAIVIAVSGTLFGRRMSLPVVQAAGVANRITEGSLDNAISIEGNDESADLLRALDAMQQDLKQRIQSEAAAAQNERIKSALDAVATAVVATDENSEVIYANQAAAELLAQVIPGNSELSGRHLGSAVKGIDQQLENTASGRLEHRWEVAQRVVDLVGASVRGDDGSFRGWVVQLFDRTQEIAAAEAERERVERERIEAAENLRIKVALDNVGSAVMVADPDRHIIYANEAAMTLFRNAEDDIRKELPHFDVDKMIGNSIDTFHDNPGHQAGLLERLSQPHQADMEIGGRSIRIVANPVIDNAGQRLGTAVEWQDRTAEVAVEREIDSLVEAASRGDLARRIELDGKTGFFHQLGTGFNALLDQLSGVFADIARVMGKMADGDLRDTIETDYDGTFDTVKRDVNQTLERMRDVVGRMSEVSDRVSSAVQEIASGNSNLSNRTEQQASSLQQTASSLEELTATVRHNADNAQQANQLASNARQTAERGGQVVTEAVEAMAQISASSSKIAEIVGVIDEIAFQTNLLALNASVEAARAGEQGRGFAVVATEVRNLASRSADAAKEIKDLIQDSGRKVESGSALVNTSGETLSEIVDSVKKVGDIVAEIAAASGQQAAGIDQVNQAVSHMDDITQQNAALAEQTSATSEQVSENANELNAVVGYFKTH
jgi:methyl-accepting chemotaxis protein